MAVTAMEDQNVKMAVDRLKLVSKYEIIMKIGSGGQGTVFLVERRGTNNFVPDLYACKSMKPGEAFEEEVQFMEHVRSLTGVVQLHEVIRDSSYCHMILELCDSSVRNRLQAIGSMSEKEAASLLKRLAITIGETHERGLIHRDLKCDNVLLTAEAPPYNVKVADFGCAAFCPRGQTINTGFMSGTERYFSPEAARGEYSSASDVWGLGLILYECLSGLQAFEGRPSEKLLQWLRAGIDVTCALDWSRISDGAKSFILQMLQNDPQKRLTIQQIIRHPWIAQNDQLGRKRKRTVKSVQLEPNKRKRTVESRESLQLPRAKKTLCRA